NCWKMKPILRLRISASWSRSRSCTPTPSRRYMPEVGRSRQPRMFIRVDLPEPDGPMIATKSPRRICSETSSRPVTFMSPMKKVRDRCSTSMTFGASLIVQGLDGIHVRGFAGGVVTEEDADQRREEESQC